jgi:hypothetical protein
MPNWCNNGLTLAHKDPAMIQRAAKALQEGTFLQEFIPCPQELIETVAGFMGRDTPEQTALEAKQKANIEKYGYSTWYEYNTNEWGTKWDVKCDDVAIEDDNTVSASFDSAWSPPIAAYEKLMELGFEIKAYYYEPGMAFVGKWEDGYDEYIEYNGHDSATVREAIGDELDDYFGISEQMAEWEADNAEE